MKSFFSEYGLVIAIAIILISLFLVAGLFGKESSRVNTIFDNIDSVRQTQTT